MGQMMLMMMIVEGVEIVVIEMVEKMVVMPRMSMIIKKKWHFPSANSTKNSCQLVALGSSQPIYQ